MCIYTHLKSKTFKKNPQGCARLHWTYTDTDTDTDISLF